MVLIYFFGLIFSIFYLEACKKVLFNFSNKKLIKAACRPLKFLD